MNNSRLSKRTLIIDCQRLLSVKLLPNSLQVKIENCSLQIFPLRRIKNICVIGNFTCDVSDLLKVAKIGIPVTWKSSSNVQAVNMMPERRSSDSLENEMECLLFDENTKLQFEDFVNCFQLHVSSILKEQLHYECTAFYMPTFLCIKNKQLYKGKDITNARDWFITFVFLDWQQAAQEYGYSVNNPIVKYLFNNFLFSVASFEGVFINALLKQDDSFNSKILAQTYHVLQDKITSLVHRYLYQTECLIATAHEKQR